MPSFKNCRLDFLQDILKGSKSALKASEVPARKVPHWPELALKHIYPQITKTHPDILQYLPAITGHLSPRYPERDFFYVVLNALHPETFEDLLAQAAKHRKPKEKNLQEEQWMLNIKEEWVEELLRYDSTSSKKGRGLSSILISSVGRTSNKRRKMNDGTDQRQEDLENEKLSEFLNSRAGSEHKQPPQADVFRVPHVPFARQNTYHPTGTKRHYNDISSHVPTVDERLNADTQIKKITTTIWISTSRTTRSRRTRTGTRMWS